MHLLCLSTCSVYLPLEVPLLLRHTDWLTLWCQPNVCMDLKFDLIFLSFVKVNCWQVLQFQPTGSVRYAAGRSTHNE